MSTELTQYNTFIRPTVEQLADNIIWSQILQKYKSLCDEFQLEGKGFHAEIECRQIGDDFTQNRITVIVKAVPNESVSKFANKSISDLCWMRDFIHSEYLKDNISGYNAEREGRYMAFRDAINHELIIRKNKLLNG